MTITRRAFVSASAGLALAPVFGGRASATVPREADIVVIGAGAAGIAAARRIAAAGRKVVVIEATNRIGGRCLTDTATFDAPFDRGARWLHNPDSNPLVKLARTVGLDIFPAPPGQKIRIGRRNARTGETEDYLATLVRANRAIDDAARAKADIACAATLPKDLGDWQSAVDFTLGASTTGKDLSVLSTLDQFNAQDRAAASSCRQGLGTLIAKLAEGSSVVLDTPATRIVWSGRDIGVETPSGRIAARAIGVETPSGRIAARAIVMTASSNVLTSGGIKFSPELPKRQLDAAAKLSLGSYDRIALQLAGNPLALGRDDVVIEQSVDNKTALLFANIGGSSLCTVDVAGSFGRALSAQGEPAMVAFAVQWLTGLFGSDVAAAVKRSSATRWNAAPYALGAMSAAAPGGQSARRVLMEPLGNLFLAGEAAHETLWGTVHGAWESGERAADAALRKIDGLRENDSSALPTRKKTRKRERIPNAAGPGGR